MARMAVDYAGKLSAAKVQLAAATCHLWFRFENSRGTHDLLFERPRQA